MTTLSWCFAQQITFKIDYYSPRDYGKGHEATNESCVQDKFGVLYFGNAGGLLQYDGINWTFIPIKNPSVWVKSLAISDNNIVYIGAQGEFGYLKPDESGKLAYVALSDQLEDDETIITDIIRVWTWKNNVVFQSEEAIYLYSENELITFYPETSFHVSSLVGDNLYVRQRGIGIMKLSGKNLQLVKGSEYMKDFGIFSILKSSNPDKYIIITPEDGFWSVDKETFEGTIIETDAEIILRQSEIYGAIRLNDGKIALNTLGNGIIITDESFKIYSIINKDNGLRDNGTLSLLQDYQGNIWAGLDNGIAQVYYSSPVSIFGPASGLSGNVKVITRYNGNLFAGTTSGLFVQNNTHETLSGAFVPIDGLTTEIRSLCLADGRLLVGTRDELFEMNNNEIRKIDNIEIYTLYYSDKLKILFISGKKNLVLYKNSGTWIKMKEISEITEEVVRFEEAIDNNTVTLWLGTSLEGIVRLKFTGPAEYRIDKYNSFDGLIDNSWAIPFKIDDNIVFSQRNGLLSFVDEKIIQSRLPDSLKNRPEFYRGYFDFFNIDSSTKRISKPFYVIEDAGQRIYVNLDGEMGYFDKSRSYSFVNQPLCLEDIGKINTIYYEEKGICWFGGNDGLLMYDENYPKDYTIDFNVLIRSVSIGGTDSIIYNGYSKDVTDKGKSDLSDRKFAIKYNLNTITISFAAPFFEGQDKMLFSHMLDGEDTTYSSWNTDSKVVLGNLWEGDYTFKVRALNAYGHISPEAIFEFRILSPWYRKTWAILLYIFIVIATVYAITRIYARRLIEKNKRLEAIIRARTREIQQKNIELQMQKEEILSSINYAQRIQNAVLPTEDLVQTWLGEHFVIFRPKDIVSGDFYWTNSYKQNVIFCVADCTGHGVPGAFMSILSISLLNEVVLKEKVLHPDEILNKVRILIIESLKQKGVRDEQKDGMDISICIYNRETSELEYAGANNPLLIIRKKDIEPVKCHRQFEQNDYILYEIKADSMPISFFDDMKPFTRHNIKIHKNDRLYLFTDGICDQFGGPKGKKFMMKSLTTSLLETITPEIKDQKKMIENRINEWQSYIDPKTSDTFSQIDDICIMGIMI